MSEKIFILCQDDLGNYEIRYDDKIFHFLWEVAPILNEQQSTISYLNERITELLQYIKKLHRRDDGMSEKRKIQRFNLDEGRIWEAIEGLSPFKTTYTLEEVCEKLNEQQSTIDKLDQENADLLGARIKAQEEWEKCTDKLKAKIVEQQATITALKEENEYFRKSRDKWKTKALQKDEQLKDCDNDCFNCRFYNKVCDFCTKFHIYTMTSGDGV